ncbi:MAG: RluA family pseudouridine synthase [Ignavibacteria bacterium]|nr:RluA family pseudouridine synthase [Ignavibacteria bacterium]
MGEHTVSGHEYQEHEFEFVIPGRQNPERLDAFITRSIEHATRTRVQAAIEVGRVTVNGIASKSNYKIKPGDVIRVRVTKPPPIQLIPQDIPLDVLFEDADVIVVNKASGMPVHPGFGNRDGTLVNAVLWHMGQRDAIEVLGNRDVWNSDDVIQAMNSNEIRPGIVHRLDKDTSGVMVVGKTYAATLALTSQFAMRTVQREYTALTWGVIKDDKRLIVGDIGHSTRDRKLMAVVQRGGKFAATEVTVVERYDCTTLATCRLKTGRTHQIRVHLAHIRHPVFADPDYGGREAALNGVHHLYKRDAQQALSVLHRQALHARLLGFVHPRTMELMQFETPVPADIMRAVSILRPTSELLLPSVLQ